MSTVLGIDFHQISENISGRETGWNGATDDHGLGGREQDFTSWRSENKFKRSNGCNSPSALSGVGVKLFLFGFYAMLVELLPLLIQINGAKF